MTVDFATGILVGAFAASLLILLVRLIQDYQKDQQPMAARQRPPRRCDEDFVGTCYKTIGREGWVIPYIKLPRGFVKMSDEALTDISIRFSHLQRELEEAKVAQPIGLDRLQEIDDWRQQLGKAEYAIQNGNFGEVGYYLGRVMSSIEVNLANWSTEGKNSRD